MEKEFGPETAPILRSFLRRYISKLYDESTLLYSEELLFEAYSIEED